MEERKKTSLPQGVEDLVHARIGQLVEVADPVEFRIVHGDPNAYRLLRDGHQRDRVRTGRVLDQTCRQILVQGGLHFLGQDGIDAMRPGRDSSVSFRDRNHEGINEQEP